MTRQQLALSNVAEREIFLVPSPPFVAVLATPHAVPTP
jgi:hypothetical protein